MVLLVKGDKVMKLRFVMCITLIVFILAAGVGLYFKASYYKDFNTEEEPLNNFMVGLMPDEPLDKVLENMEENLGTSNVIIAAKCEDTFTYRFKCTSQKVTIEHVFKGEGLKAGDNIEIIRDGSCIFMDESMYVDGKIPINLDFVNEMIPGKTYLIFLDRKLETHDDTIIYLQSEEFAIAPIFCYDNTIKNKPIAGINNERNSARYEDVKDNEFFLKSEEAIEKMVKFKDNLLQKYSY